jgi:hypothetical protein
MEIRWYLESAPKERLMVLVGSLQNTTPPMTKGVLLVGITGGQTTWDLGAIPGRVVPEVPGTKGAVDPIVVIVGTAAEDAAARRPATLGVT